MFYKIVVSFKEIQCQALILVLQTSFERFLQALSERA